MIKFDNSIKSGAVCICEGSIEQVAMEYGALGKALYDTISKANGKESAEFFDIFARMYYDISLASDKDERDKIIEEYKPIMEQIKYVHALQGILNKVNEKTKNDNILRSEFNSDEEFKKWFHGGDEDADQ